MYRCAAARVAVAGFTARERYAHQRWVQLPERATWSLAQRHRGGQKRSPVDAGARSIRSKIGGTPRFSGGSE
jgi:hypothetical protein